MFSPCVIDTIAKRGGSPWAQTTAFRGIPGVWPISLGNHEECPKGALALDMDDALSVPQTPTHVGAAEWAPITKEQANDSLIAHGLRM
jgi:hypothetical protein